MKFSVAHPNSGKRSAENLTKISRQISRHLWQRKTEKKFTSALLQGSCSEIFFGGINSGEVGKSKRELSKRGLSPKGANWAQKGPFGGISAAPPPRGCESAEESVPISSKKAPIGPEKAPIRPEKARFSQKDFCPIFSQNLGA